MGRDRGQGCEGRPALVKPSMERMTKLSREGLEAGVQAPFRFRKARRAEIDRTVSEHMRRSRNVAGWDLDVVGDPDVSGTVALQGNQVVGLHAYVLLPAKHTLYSRFTWVVWHYRRQGVAARLWARTLAREKPVLVDVRPISPGGDALTRRLVATYLGIVWLGVNK